MPRRIHGQIPVSPALPPLTVVLFIVTAALFAAGLSHATDPTVTPPLSGATCPDLAAQLAEQELRLARELRTIKRDLAALRQDLDEPGLGDIVAGVGYIVGLFGAAAFVASRRNNDSGKD